MDTDLFAALEQRLERLIEQHLSIRRENEALREENMRLLQEREAVKSRIDGILKKLEEI